MHHSHPGFDRTAIARSSVGEPLWNDVAFAGYRELVVGVGVFARPQIAAGSAAALGISNQLGA